MASPQIALPEDFEFGVATAAYQVEGAVNEGDRGVSIWDAFSHTPGKTFDGHTGDVACDHYHRYAEDIDLMARLGVDTYRMSVAWPRIQPTGKGPANTEGLAFYDRLVDGLLAKGITPTITLYHWDLPQALEDAGGWRVRDTVERFVEYAQIVQEHLGDRVRRWITMNEPYCSSILGYATGRHAPGAHEGEGALAAAHHLLLGHGMAAHAMRAQRSDQQIGITLNLQPVVSASDSPADTKAAERELMLANLLFTDPVLAGSYPQVARDEYAQMTDFAFIRDGDLATIAAPLDFLGVNYYFPSCMRAREYREQDPALRTADDIATEQVIDDGAERTAMGWPVDSDGLRRLLTWLHTTYPMLPPIYITENGIACDDVVSEAGRVHDPARVRYLENHLRAVAQATHEGVVVHGYYCWSILDNFEWDKGYAKRFGLVYVDYKTQQRIPKSSFEWYRRLIAAHHEMSR